MAGAGVFNPFAQPAVANYDTPMDPAEALERLRIANQSKQQGATLSEQQREFDAQMAARQQALTSLTSQISSMGGGGSPSASVGGGFTHTPVSAPTGPGYQAYDDAADTKAYARAKDNTGLALQASLKGLQATMASRGISGSGIEGGETTKLFQSGLSDLANTDATQAGTSAAHAFTDAQSSKALGEQGREFDVGQGTDVSKFNAGLIADKQSKTLSSILQAYGSLY